MALIVQKFGGTSLADRSCIYNVAGIITQKVRKGNRVVTVVSAQGDTTDRLLSSAWDIAKNPCPRELDALLSTGEQASAALLAMAVSELGVPSVSLNGFQSGIQTDGNFGDASITAVQSEALRRLIGRGAAVIVAGFQGIDEKGNITTLGRGGSDASAVALAAALQADSCCIYKDVDGIYSADPRIDPKARKYDHLSYDKMLELCDKGSGVLQRRSVELAKFYRIKLQICSSFQQTKGTTIGESGQ